MAIFEEKYEITKHICPRNCYDACSMLAYTRNGVLEKVTGNPEQPYTNGKICAKGYSYVERVYHPERLKYPMRQKGRGTGKWERISWEEAIELISDKIIELNQRYHSNQALCLNKYSGNFGLLHHAVEGFFNSLGSTTQVVGSPCWSAGLDAQYYDFGAAETSDPSDMREARLIILWGSNPAWTAIHSMPYIYQAQENGAKLIVIDPVRTSSAKRADAYIQVTPGGDGALALAIAKILVEKDCMDSAFIAQYTHGWSEFEPYLNSLDLNELSAVCGVQMVHIYELADAIAEAGHPLIWIGFGIQRHGNGGQNMRAIHALAALTGSIGKRGAGVQFAQLATWQFNSLRSGAHPVANRTIPVNEFADELDKLSVPPIRFLWVACRNILTQDPQTEKLKKKLAGVEMIVTVDHFLTPTAEQSDIVLPATTQFEEEDVVSSYWHHYIGYNQKAIEPYFECKSDLEIAMLLSKALNEKSPNFCSFPTTGSTADFIEAEFNEELHQLLEIEHWQELVTEPKKANLPRTAWSDGIFKTPSKKFEFYSARAVADGLPGIAELRSGKKPSEQHPYWLLTPHAQYGLNSQFQNLSWVLKGDRESVVYMHPVAARQKGLEKGEVVTVYNDLGEIDIELAFSSDLPQDIVLFYQGWCPENHININKLIHGYATDMGQVETGSQGIAYYDAFVGIRKK